MKWKKITRKRKKKPREMRTAAEAKSALMRRVRLIRMREFHSEPPTRALLKKPK
jgi:hypothetical protein